MVIGQANVNSRPVWKTNINGTIGAMLFAPNQRLKISNYAANVSCGFVIVLYQTQPSSVYYASLFSNANTPGWSTIYTSGNTGKIGRYAYTGNPQYENSNAVLASPSPMTILLFNFDAIAGNWELYKNGISQGYVGYTGMYNSTAADFYLNYDKQYGGSTLGYVFDVMHFRAKMSAEQISSVNNYLKAKYGL